LSQMSHASEKCRDAIPERDEESVREVGEQSPASDQEAPHGEEDRTICQWIERMSYRFLGTAFTSFIIRRRFVLTRVLIVFAYWVVGVQYYSQMEHWNPMDSAYFITVTTTTVGYGDFHPTRDTTRLFTIFYAIFGIAFVLSAVSDLINYLLVRKLQTKVLNAIGVVKLESRAWFKLIFSASCIITMIAVGTTFFHLNEKYGDDDEKAGQSWTPITSLYWTIITMLTIGYGDLTISESGRAFSLWFIWTCVVIYIMAITNILDTFEELKNDALRKEILRSHRVDILELLENDRRERETLTNDGVGLLGGLHRRDSLSSIYPTKNPSDALTYENSPIDLSKTEIELALTLSSKPTMSPLMTHNSLKALFLPATDSSSPADEDAGSNSFSSHQVFLGSRGSIESSSPMRSSSMAEQSFERRGTLYKNAGGDENPVRVHRPSKRTSIFEDPAALQAKVDRFVISMLVKMKKVDQVRDIDPLVQHFKAIGMMREEHRDASKEVRNIQLRFSLSFSFGPVSFSSHVSLLHSDGCKDDHRHSQCEQYNTKFFCGYSCRQ